MPLDDFLPIEGDVFNVTEGHVFIKRANVIENFVWGGECMRITEGDVDEGTATVTTKLNVRGGIKRDQVHDGTPGPSTFTLEMKRTRGNKIKTELRRCWWMIDQRMVCGGIDRDAWNNWREITRYCHSNTNNRTMTGIDWESPDGEAMVGFPMTALETVDIYRTNGAGQTITYAGFLNDVNVCRESQCPGKCDPQEECMLAAVGSLVGAGSPSLFINLEGGDPTAWTETILTEWTTADADRVLCLGDFLIIVSTGEVAILRSDDLGVTRYEVDDTVVTDWTSNAPTCIDGINQTMMVMGGLNGYVYRSTNAGRDWDTVSSGQATDQDLANIRICRDDPNVMYAVGADNAFIKSTNGGRTFFPLTGPSAGDALLDAYPLTTEHLIVINDDAEFWESSDGGLTWTQQLTIDDNLPATLTAARLDSCGCDGVWAVLTDATNNLVLRNVDNGSDGRWYERIDREWEGDGSGFLDYAPAAIACCGPNRAVIVGGSGTDAFVYELSN